MIKVSYSTPEDAPEEDIIFAETRLPRVSLFVPLGERVRAPTPGLWVAGEHAPWCAKWRILPCNCPLSVSGSPVRGSR